MSRKLLLLSLVFLLFLINVKGAVIYVNSTNCSTQFKKVKPGDTIVFVNGTYSNATCGPIDAYNITFELYNNTTIVYWNGPLLLINNNTTVTNFYYNFFPYNLSYSYGIVSGFASTNKNNTPTNLQIQIISPLNSNCTLTFNLIGNKGAEYYFGEIISSNSSLYIVNSSMMHFTVLSSGFNIIINNSLFGLFPWETPISYILAENVYVNNSRIGLIPVNNSTISFNFVINNSSVSLIGNFSITNLTVNNSNLTLNNINLKSNYLYLNNLYIYNSNFGMGAYTHVKTNKLYVNKALLQTIIEYEYYLNNSTLKNLILNTSIVSYNTTILNAKIASINLTSNYTTLSNITFINTTYFNSTYFTPTTKIWYFTPSFIVISCFSNLSATNLYSNSSSVYNLTIGTSIFPNFTLYNFTLTNSNISTFEYLQLGGIQTSTIQNDYLKSNYIKINPWAFIPKNTIIQNSKIISNAGNVITYTLNYSIANTTKLLTFNVLNSVVNSEIQETGLYLNVSIYNSSVYKNITVYSNLSINDSKLYNNVHIYDLCFKGTSNYLISTIQIENSELYNATILANITTILNSNANNITIINETKFGVYKYYVNPIVKISSSTINYLLFKPVYNLNIDNLINKECIVYDLNSAQIYINNITTNNLKIYNQTKTTTLTNSTVSNINISASGNLLLNNNKLGNTYIKNNNITLTNNNISATNVNIQMLNNTSKLYLNYNLINTSSLTLTTFSMYPNFTGYIKLENTTFKVLNPHLIPFQLNYNYYIYNVTLNSESILNGNVTNTSAYEIIMFNNGTCSNVYNVSSNVTFGCGNISNSNITLIYTPFNNITITNSDFAEIVAKNSSVTITNSKVYYYHFPSVYALYNNFSIIANYLNINGLDCEINKSCILFSDANGTINNSKLCPTNSVSLGIVNTSQNFYVYDSYFDNLVLVPNYNIYNITIIPLDQLVNYILDYPDSNYYCNGTPRFTVTTTKTNVTNVTKTVVYVNIPIQVAVPGDLAKSTPAFGFKLLMIFVTFFIPILFLVIAFLTTLAESKK